MSDTDLRSLLQEVRNQQVVLEAQVKDLGPALKDLSAKFPVALASDDIQSGKHAAANLRALAKALGVAPAGSEDEQAKQWQLGLEKVVGQSVVKLTEADIKLLIGGWQGDLKRLAEAVEDLGQRLGKVQTQVGEQTKELVDRLGQAETRAAAAEASLSEARAQLVELGALADGLLNVADSLNQVSADAQPAGQASP